MINHLVKVIIDVQILNGLIKQRVKMHDLVAIHNILIQKLVNEPDIVQIHGRKMFLNIQTKEIVKHIDFVMKLNDEFFRILLMSELVCMNCEVLG
jgi:hypothetical protein